MYLLCVDLASNYLVKYARERHLELDIGELSHDSAVYVIEQYLRKPEFRVSRISAYMHFGCVKSLYRDKKREQQEVSYIESMGSVYYADPMLNEEGSLDEGRHEPVEGFKMKALRHEPAMVKQWLLFENSTTGKDYEEILV
jgi:hypothetical protein